MKAIKRDNGVEVIAVQMVGKFLLAGSTFPGGWYVVLRPNQPPIVLSPALFEAEYRAQATEC